MSANHIDSTDAMPNIREYLQSLKLKFNATKFEDSNLVHVVLGNEAADADSIISSICYAYYKQHLCHPTDSLIKEQVVYVPVACIQRSDVHLRRDVKLLLEAVGMSLTDIICAEELFLKDIHAMGKLRLTLVDHNSLHTTFAEFDECVEEILDHHKDGGRHVDRLPEGSQNRSIAFDDYTGKPTAGSCCTQVAEKIFGNSSAVIFERINNEALAQLCTMLLAVIALDTINMNVDAAIGTNRDREMLRVLYPYILNNCTQDSLFDMMRGAKTDAVFWAELSVYDVLRIDYKKFSVSATKLPGAVGASSAMVPIGRLLEKPSLGAMLAQWMDEQHVSLQVVMCLITAPVLRRELMLVSREESVLQAADRFLLAAGEGKYDLHLLSEEQELLQTVLPTSGLFGRVYHQGNVKASRKVMAPDLINFAEIFQP